MRSPASTLVRYALALSAGSATLTNGFTYTSVQPTVSFMPASGYTYTGLALGTGVLDAMSTTPGTFAYTATISGGSPVAVTAATVLAAGSYTLTRTLPPPIRASSAMLRVRRHLRFESSTFLWGSPLVRSAQRMPAVTRLCPPRLAAAARWRSITPARSGRSPTAIALDQAGNAWVANSAGSVTKIPANGPGGTTYPAGGTTLASGIATDATSNVWVVGTGSAKVSEFGPEGTLLSGTGYSVSSGGNAIAINPK